MSGTKTSSSSCSTLITIGSSLNHSSIQKMPCVLWLKEGENVMFICTSFILTMTYIQWKEGNASAQCRRCWARDPFSTTSITSVSYKSQHKMLGTDRKLLAEKKLKHHLVKQPIQFYIKTKDKTFGYRYKKHYKYLFSPFIISDHIPSSFV